MPAPRYLRFARALALCSSLAVVPSCSDDTPVTDAGGDDAPSTADTPVALDAPSAEDAPVTADAPTAEDAPASQDAPISEDASALLDSGDCSTCDCGLTAVDAGLPSCDSLGLFICCAVVGPLAPPDLPA